MPNMKKITIQDFIQLIAALRHPKTGCPWDIQQTFNSMIACLLEESYEVVEAIEQQDFVNLKEELGDLLLQVVFLSQLACEQNLFTFQDVLENVQRKIIRRHPHVFGEYKAKNSEEALQNWEAIKQQERQEKQQHSILDNLPHALPALIRAEKIQKRCAKVGFDWQEVTPVLAKVTEELQEVQAELDCPHQDQEKIQEEMGDLLFATVNLARHLGCRAEESLRSANQKFERRFRQIEDKLAQRHKTLQQTGFSEMDQLWNEIKQEEK